MRYLQSYNNNNNTYKEKSFIISIRDLQYDHQFFLAKYFILLHKDFNKTKLIYGRHYRQLPFNTFVTLQLSYFV